MYHVLRCVLYGLTSLVLFRRIFPFFLLKANGFSSLYMLLWRELMRGKRTTCGWVQKRTRLFPKLQSEISQKNFVSLHTCALLRDSSVTMIYILTLSLIFSISFSLPVMYRLQATHFDSPLWGFCFFFVKVSFFPKKERILKFDSCAFIWSLRISFDEGKNCGVHGRNFKN